MRGKPGQQLLDLLHIPRSHSAFFDRAFTVQVQNYRLAFYQRILKTTHLSTDLKASWSVICYTVTKTRDNVTALLQLLDAEPRVVFGRTLNQPWLALSGTDEKGHCRVR